MGNKLEAILCFRLWWQSVVYSTPRYMRGSFFVPLDAIPRIGLPIYNIYDASGNDRSPISNSLQHSIYLCLHSGLFGIGDRSFPQVSIDAT